VQKEVVSSVYDLEKKRDLIQMSENHN